MATSTNVNSPSSFYGRSDGARHALASARRDEHRDAVNAQARVDAREQRIAYETARVIRAITYTRRGH